jgi:hypothetical protein
VCVCVCVCVGGWVWDIVWGWGGWVRGGSDGGWGGGDFLMRGLVSV